MPKRRFELPRIQDLTKEQEVVRALPLEGQHLIIGGPGTGKSVVALMRARRLAAQRLEYKFLVFNHLLSRASGQLQPKLSQQTWMKWFTRLFKVQVGQPVPRLPAEDNDEYAEIDWKAARSIAQTSPAPENCPFLVIDEGQDMPPGFYECLICFGFENFFVVADQNQQITRHKSSRQDIELALGLDTGDVIELTRNFRNNYTTARLASTFRTADPASPAPCLPKPSGIKNPVNLALLAEYEPDCFDDIARRILRRWEQNPQWLVGVIAPNNEVRTRYFKGLKALAGSLQTQGSSPRIKTFATNYRSRVRFDEGGILVINAQACKGLEFDAVVCADIDAHYVDPADPDMARKMFYVMVSRACQQVVLLVRSGHRRYVMSILTEDRSILKRVKLRCDGEK